MKLEYMPFGSCHIAIGLKKINDDLAIAEIEILTVFSSLVTLFWQ